VLQWLVVVSVVLVVVVVLVDEVLVKGLVIGSSVLAQQVSKANRCSGATAMQQGGSGRHYRQ